MAYVGRDQYYEEPLANPSAMWTDLYELTMAQTLFFEGRHNQQTTFNGFIRKTPYNGTYLVTAGQNIINEWLDKNWKFTDRDLYRLAQKTVKNPETGADEKLFKPEFLDMLKNAKLEISVDMMPEGEIAFANEPICKVSGPAWQCLAVEGAILNTINSQSNFATYAAILKKIANGKQVLEFGMRRAQDVGCLAPTRGAYVGGVDGSSNCWAESVYGINTVGTMAHAYVMMHEDEATAFSEWAKHNPYLGAFLVDTYDTIEGVKRAIEACKKHGIKLSGIRLDSGNLEALAKEAREVMDLAGFEGAKIIVSNDLDSKTVYELEKAKTPIDTYAVGTNLVTVKEQPALGAVYKVATVYSESLTSDEIDAMKKAVKEGTLLPQFIRSKVRDIMKLSEDAIKMTFPGELDVIRHLKKESDKMFFNGDTICPEWQKDPIDADGKLNRNIVSVQNSDRELSKIFNKGSLAYRPLKTFIKKGKLVGDIETVHIARERAKQRIAMLPEEHREYINPKAYIVGVDEALIKRQNAMAKHLKKTGNTVEANVLVA